jgi:hypothetical protein
MKHRINRTTPVEIPENYYARIEFFEWSIPLASFIKLNHTDYGRLGQFILG